MSTHFSAAIDSAKTLAEVEPERKNEVSHRAKALKIFYEKLKEAGYADK